MWIAPPCGHLLSTLNIHSSPELWGFFYDFFLESPVQYTSTLLCTVIFAIFNFLSTFFFITSDPSSPFWYIRMILSRWLIVKFLNVCPIWHNSWIYAGATVTWHWHMILQNLMLFSLQVVLQQLDTHSVVMSVTCFKFSSILNPNISKFKAFSRNHQDFLSLCILMQI